MAKVVKECDILILGAGPAGLSCALYAARAGLDTIVLEKDGIGGIITTTDLIENYPGAPEDSTGFSITERMEAQARQFGAKFSYNVVDDVRFENNRYICNTVEGDYVTKTIVIATGSHPRTLEIPGEKLFTGRGVSYCATCDANFFRGKHVAVVGAGESAVKEAQYLSNFASKVTMIVRKPKFKASGIILDRILNNEKIEVMFNTTVESINGDGKVSDLSLKNVLDGSESNFDVDGIFIFAGSEPNSFIPGLEVDTNESGFITTDEYMQTGLDGVYAAGDVRDSFLHQVITACADGAISAMKAYEYIESMEK